LITSTANPIVQQVRRLNAKRKERMEKRSYVAEGVRLLEEIWDAEHNIQQVYYSEPLSERSGALLKELKNAGVAVEEVSESVLKAMSDTETPQGILAIVEMIDAVLPASPQLILILDGIHDPGNLGTILRTAVAAGVELVFLAPNCADLYNPKVIRSAMGNHCRIPIRQVEWQQIEHYCASQQDLRIYAAAMENGISLWEEDLRGPAALIIGSEAEGISIEAQQLAVKKIFIPMAPEVESLNAAVAAGILMYEVVRQRTEMGRKRGTGE
jgi:TrmH family RNA methyltransferase